MSKDTGTGDGTPYYPGIEAFEAAEIDPEQFGHCQHVFVGWSYLQRCNLRETLQRYSDSLKKITEKLGAEGKYHETITWFFIFQIAEKLAQNPAASWHEFRDANRELCEDGSGLLRRHYSTARIESELARRSFLLPDK